jgi:hypothetical protein
MTFQPIFIFYCRYENDQLRLQGLDFTNIVTQVQNSILAVLFSYSCSFQRLIEPLHSCLHLCFCAVFLNFLPHPPACVMVARVAPPKAQVRHSHEYCDRAPAYLALQLICCPFLPCPTGFQFPGCDSVCIVHSDLRDLCPHLTCRRRSRRSCFSS